MVRAVLIFAASAVVTATGNAAGQEATSSNPSVSVHLGGQVIGGAAWLRAASPAEPGNQVLDLAETTCLTEMRADGRLDLGHRLQVIARPRLRAANRGLAAGSAKDGTHATFEVTEAYAAWRPADAVAVFYGLQNFQWGPAELMSPSNRIFHEVGVFRDPLYTVRGRHLARLNASIGRQWSLVALADLDANGEEPFRSEERFRRAGQVKAEYSSASGAVYAGITAGTRGGERPWAGGYASAMLTDSLSTYLDWSVQRGSQAWYPGRADGVPSLIPSERAAGSRLLALTGVRYAFSTALDVRIEYLRQDAGYTRAQLHEATAVLADAPSPQVLGRWLRPGLEFLGRDLVFVSVQSRELPPSKRWDVQGRYLRSLTDGSGVVFLTSSLAAAGALVVFGSVTVSHGPVLAEFTRLTRSGGVAGITWSW